MALYFMQALSLSLPVREDFVLKLHFYDKKKKIYIYIYMNLGMSDQWHDSLSMAGFSGSVGTIAMVAVQVLESLIIISLSLSA